MNYNELWHQLAPLYGDGEAKAIAQMVYEVRFLIFTSAKIHNYLQMTKQNCRKLPKD